MARKLVGTVILTLTIVLLIGSAHAQTASLQLPEALELAMNLGGDLASQSFTVIVGDVPLNNATFTPETLTKIDGDQTITFTIDPAQVPQLAAGASQTVQVSVTEPPTATGTYNGNITVRYDELGDADPLTIGVTLTVTEAGEVAVGPFELSVTAAPGNTAVPVMYKVVSTDTDVRLLFFLAQPETAVNQLDAVHLTGYVSGSTGEPVSAPTFAFKSNNEDVTTAGLNVPAGGRQTLVEITIAALPETGTYTVFLITEHQGKVIETNVATIDRVAELFLPVGDMVLIAGSVPGEDTIAALEVSGTATTAIVPFFLRQPVETTEPLANVKLQGFLTKETGAIETGATFTYKHGGDDISATGITVPAGGREVPVELTISNLPTAGMYTVHLFAEQQGRVVELPTISLMRSETPTLSVVGSESGSLTLSRTVSAFDHDFRIASSNETTVSDLQIIVDDLVGPDGNPVETSWQLLDPVGGEAPFTVPGRGEIIFNIKAELPLADEYKSSITLIYAEKREVTNLTVNRTRPAATIEVLGPGTIHGQTWFGKLGNTKMSVVLRNTGSQTVQVEQITPIRLERLEGGDGKVDVLADLQYELMTGDGQIRPETFDLAGGQSQELVLAIEGLDRVGTYEGDLILDAADATPPAAKTFTMKLKAPWWWAVIVIGTSVIISYLFRRWFGSGLPRRQRQRRILLLLGDLAHLEKRFTDLESKEIALLEKIRTRANELFDDPDLGTDKNADTVLNEVEKKLSLVPVIVEARRRIRALRPPEAFIELAQKWEDIVNHFIDNIDTDISNEENELDALLKTGIDNAVKDHILTKLDEFDTQVTNQDTFFPETKAQLNEKVIEYIATGKTDANAGKIQEAIAALEAARKAYVILLVQDLNRYLPTVPPGYADEAAWKSTRQEIENKLQSVLVPDPATTADQLLEVYQASYRLYLSKVISALAIDVEEYLEKIANGRTLTDEQKETFTETLNGFVKKLAGAQADIANGLLNNAGKAYLAVRDAYLHEDVLGAIKKALGEKLGGRSGAKTAAPGDKLPAEGAPPAGVVVGDVAPESALPQRHRKDIAALEREIKIMERVAFALALFLAILGGLQLLWASNATWGSLGDIVVAVFWGLGLHQVSSASVSTLGTFPGLANLIKSIGNPSGDGGAGEAES